MRIVVNADSLETWFIHALGALWDVLIHVEVDDESVRAQHLRDGVVSSALSADGRPVPGCDFIPLGALRYLATASPARPGLLGALVFGRDNLRGRYGESTLSRLQRQGYAAAYVAATPGY